MRHGVWLPAMGLRLWYQVRVTSTHQSTSEKNHMLALITTAHHTSYPNPIGFSAGERVRIGHEDDEFPGWVRTFTTDGNEGGGAAVAADAPRGRGGAGAPGLHRPRAGCGGG